MWTCPISQYTSLTEAGIGIREQFAFVVFLIRSVLGRKKMEAKSKLLNHIGDDEFLAPYSFRMWRFSSAASARFLTHTHTRPAPLFCKVNGNRIFIIAFVDGMAFISDVEVFH